MDIFDTTQILPKLWLARIQKYWDIKIPTGYPDSSSIFSFATGDAKAAVIDMESHLDTEDSIIDPESIPDRQAVGNYLGSYVIECEEGERTLLSPVRVPANAVGVLAYRLNNTDEPGGTFEDPVVVEEEEEGSVGGITPPAMVEEEEDDEPTREVAETPAETPKETPVTKESAWVKLENVEIVDGYVWGETVSGSPVAVFVLRKDSYVDDSRSQLDMPVYICNGIPTKVYKNAEDKIVAENAYGKITEIDSTYGIIGGSYDASPVETTDVAVFGGVTLNTVVAGSWYSVAGENFKNHSKLVKVSIKDSTIGLVTGAGVWNSADEVVMNLENTKVTRGMGSQMTHYKGKTANGTLAESEKKLLANQWVKKATVTVKNCEIYVLYGGANNGYCYTKEAYLYADNCKCTYLSTTQSNGTIDYNYNEITNCEVEYLNSNNRGHAGDVKVIFKGIKSPNMWVFADPAPDKEMADIKTIDIDMDATSDVKLAVGAISNVEVTTEAVAKEHIKALRISRSAKVEYIDNADKILKNIISIK